MRRLLVLLVALPVVSLAQVSTLQAGDRIRLTSAQGFGAAQIGTLMAPIQDSVVLALTRPPVAGTGDLPTATQYRIALAAVQKIEISQRKSRGRGAIRGALVGLVLTGAFGVACLLDDYGGLDICPLYAALVGSFLVPSGAIFGALIQTERWRQVYP